MTSQRFHLAIDVRGDELAEVADIVEHIAVEYIGGRVRRGELSIPAGGVVARHLLSANWSIDEADSDRRILRSADRFGQVSVGEALRAADDFLVGLMKFHGVLGYDHPGVGGVSARFVLAQVRSARFARSLDLELPEIGTADPKTLRFLNDQRELETDW